MKYQRLIFICALFCPSCAATNAPTEDARFIYGARVVDFTPGLGAGYGQNKMPSVVLGPPKGGNLWRGSIDVLSLGSGGEILLELDTEVEDHPGPDFIVFENAFQYGDELVFEEFGAVAVSEDGEIFVEFDCSPTEQEQCAGRSPRRGEHPEWDPDVVGGDAFDLSDIGVSAARFVRIRDVSTTPVESPTTGFDLDAILGFRP